MDWIGHHLDIAHWGLGFDHHRPGRDRGPGRVPDDRDLQQRRSATGSRRNTPTARRSSSPAATTRSRAGRSGSAKTAGSGSTAGSSRPSPPISSRRSIGPNEIKLIKSRDHYQNFLDCVRSRALTIAPCEVAHRSASVGHLGVIAIETGRKIHWDPGHGNDPRRSGREPAPQPGLPQSLAASRVRTAMRNTKHTLPAAAMIALFAFLAVSFPNNAFSQAILPPGEARGASVSRCGPGQARDLRRRTRLGRVLAAPRPRPGRQRTSPKRGPPAKRRSSPSSGRKRPSRRKRSSAASSGSSEAKPPSPSSESSSSIRTSPTRPATPSRRSPAKRPTRPSLPRFPRRKRTSSSA